jgi:hypothetical protein
MSIKGIRIDQGQKHAEKRSNHVHTPLIDGKRRQAGATPARRRGGKAVTRRGGATAAAPLCAGMIESH